MAKRQLTEQQKRRIESNQQLGDQTQKAWLIARYGKQADVMLCDSHERITCQCRQNLPNLVVGDIVAVEKPDGEQAVITTRLPRKTALIRYGFHGDAKPMAANITQVFITIPVAETLDTLLIDRYLAACEINRLQPVLVINKVDLFTEAALATVQQTCCFYQSLGYPCLLLMALHPVLIVA